MKKFLTMALCMTLMILMLTGCTKADCWWCGEEKWCGTMTIWGEEVPVCPACEREIEDVRNEMMGED